MHPTITTCLPPSLRQIMAKLSADTLVRIEEIRIREQRPMEVVLRANYQFVTETGELTDNPAYAYMPSREDCAKLLDLLTHHSLYTYEEELRRGFITIAGGHRVGLAGRTVLEDGQVRMIRDISGFNIRIAREVHGCANRVLPYLLDKEKGGYHHTLFISPPQFGKTTLVREVARSISAGFIEEGVKWGGKKVAIVDERSELAACVKGVPHFNVGPRTDVLDGCPKAEGMLMLIRSMSPEVLIVDEIGRQEDALALREAIHAGVQVMATAHGWHLEDAWNRPTLAELGREKFFTRYVVLHGKGVKGRLFSVYNQTGLELVRQADLSSKPSGASTSSVSAVSFMSSAATPATISTPVTPIPAASKYAASKGNSRRW